MDKKRLDYYKKKLATRREELVRAITRTEQEGREADEDTTVDMADKAANSYTKEFLFGQTHNDRSLLNLVDQALNRIKDGSYGECNSCHDELQQKAARGRTVDALLHYLPGKDGARAAVSRPKFVLPRFLKKLRVCSFASRARLARIRSFAI